MISIINYQKMGICISLSVFFLCASAFAQEDSKEQLLQQFEQTYQEMFQRPHDVDITMKYAKLAVQLGDYEAAIPPLERILMFNPDLPKIKLQLGVLYYKLDSMKMAKSYFQGAVASKNVSEEIKATASEYLNKIKG